MSRPPLFVPAIAIVVLLAAVPAGVAPAASSKTEATAWVEFTLRANRGLHAKLEASNGEISLEIRRKGRLVSYRVEGEATEAGLKAQFGDLGLIDVTFRPTETLSTSEPPKRCEGEPWTRSEGFFVGTIEFTGEREYVRIEASRAKGLMTVYPEWQCDLRKGPIRNRSAPQGLARDSRAEEEPATLSAFSRRCRCGFTAVGARYRNGRGRSIFLGVKVESREGMEIGRLTIAYAGASTFAFDHAAGTATVHPPPPFSGHATFKRRPRGRDLWRSTIRAPLLGVDPVSPRGPSFRTVLRREYPFD
jgi:hypothetical protein